MSDADDQITTCPYCFKEIRLFSNFCKYCGKPLKRCLECNGLNTIESRFCRNCGKELPLESQEPSVVYQPSPATVSPTIQSFPISPTQSVSPMSFFSSGYYLKAKQYEPISLTHPYSRTKIGGFLSGPIPTVNVISTTFEAIGLSLGYIAVGVSISSIILSMGFNLLTILLSTFIAAPFILSAPFFGIYYVISRWMYKIFAVKPPLNTRTMLINYFFGTLWLSIIAIFLTPIVLYVDILTFAVFMTIPIVLISMILIIIPLKALVADMVYIKAAIEEQKRENGKEKIKETQAEENIK